LNSTSKQSSKENKNSLKKGEKKFKGNLLFSEEHNEEKIAWHCVMFPLF